MQRKLEAIIFDVDGTLADTERDGHRLAFNQAFHEAGLDWVWDTDLYGELLSITGGKERIRHYILKYRSDLSIENFEEMIPVLHAEKTRKYVQLLNEKGIPPRPGVLRLINEARNSGIRLAVATTTTEENVRALFLSQGISMDWFEVIGAGDIVERKKPDPGIYLYVLEKMQISADRVIAIEDSRNGLISALGASLPVLITVNEYTKNEEFTGALSVVSDLGEIEKPCVQLQGLSFEGDIVNISTLSSLLNG